MNWTLALPEIVLGVCGMAILLYGVLRKSETGFIATMLTLGALLLALMLVISRGVGFAYEGLFVVDPFSSFNNILVLASAALALILSLDFNLKEGIGRCEFPVLVLFATAGMMIMGSSSNLMTLYLGLELQNLALYVLVAFARDDLRSSEAGLKFFVLSALASGLLLYGISLAYGFSGTMDIRLLAHALGNPADVTAGLVVGIVFVIAGLCFKLAIVPFHMWTPDVYEGAPTPVAAFISMAPKVAAFAVLLRTMAVSFGNQLPHWQLLLVLIAIASMLLGSLGAIGQANIKRLMAYSSIANMGYALIGLASGNLPGVRGTLVYVAIYVFMTAGAFAVITAMRRRGRALERIADLGGLGARDPKMALAMTVFMFALAGIPPLSGFFAKLYVFLAAVENGMWALAIIGVLTSVVGAYYYIRVVKVMYFDPAEPAFDPVPRSVGAVAWGAGAFSVLFVLFAPPIFAAAQSAAQVLLLG
jgi:NADH-quinone oxidoreductase subunit N